MTRSVKCAGCGASLMPRDVVAAGPFSCPSCGARLQATKRYADRISLGSLLFSVVASLALGYKGLHLLYEILLLLLVFNVLGLRLLKYVVPPRIEVAVPQLPLREKIRQIYGPTELKLRDKGRPSTRDAGTDKASRT
jgi:small basic protein